MGMPAKDGEPPIKVFAHHRSQHIPNGLAREVRRMGEKYDVE